MSKYYLLAFDLGATSGRAILGTLEDGRLSLEEIHRFQNRMVQIHGSFYWNVFGLFEELKTGLRKCITEFGIQPDSIGINTWGVDYSLLNREGQIIGLPYAYRDHRTDSVMEEFFKIKPAKKIYESTGIQFLQINSLYQLYVSAKQKHSVLDIAESLLFMPDTLNYLFTGIKRNEYTIASTSQLLKAGEPEWAYKLFKKARISKKLAGEIIQPGNILGSLTEEVCRETRSKSIPCIAVASHDTASAVVSVPATDGNWAYISSGAWSVMGIENSTPIVNDESLAKNFTNEGGVDGTNHFLKNIMGMWLIQECKRIWDQEWPLEWSELMQMSKASLPFKSLINPDDPMFLNPVNMPEAIRNFCLKSGQPIPETKGEITRCIYDSLILKYKHTLSQIESVTGKKIDKIHIIGGGAYNREINQLTANATVVPVFAGPTDATAIGNIMYQAKGLGLVGSLTEIREIIRNSFEVNEFQPNPKLDWENAYTRFCRLI
jgi:rhamnulokinase